LGLGQAIVYRKITRWLCSRRDDGQAAERNRGPRDFAGIRQPVACRHGEPRHGLRSRIPANGTAEGNSTRMTNWYGFTPPRHPVNSNQNTCTQTMVRELNFTFTDAHLPYDVQPARTQTASRLPKRSTSMQPIRENAPSGVPGKLARPDGWGFRLRCCLERFAGVGQSVGVHDRPGRLDSACKLGGGRYP
jgi:hypothetical protein